MYASNLKNWSNNILPIIKESKWSIIVDSDELMTGQHNKNIKYYLKNIPKNIHCIYIMHTLYIRYSYAIHKLVICFLYIVFTIYYIKLISHYICSI